jgi:hypothetical protein
MKSARRAARSGSAGYRSDSLPELVIATIIYLGPPLICAAPLVFLYWLYRPTVLTNPGLRALKAPMAMALLLPSSQPESREDVETSNPAARADVADDFDEIEPTDKKPKSRTGTGGLHRIAGRRGLRFAGSARRPAPAHSVSLAVTNPGQHTGMNRGPAFAYAYAVEQSGRHWW